MLGVALAGAAAADPPAAPPPPPGSAPRVATPGAPREAAPGAGQPDDDFIEFLGADDDAVRWEFMKNAAEHKGKAPGSPPQDAAQ